MNDYPIRVGIGGWTYAPWRGPFYPEGLAQAKEQVFAAAIFVLVESNVTRTSRNRKLLVR